MQPAALQPAIVSDAIPTYYVGSDEVILLGESALVSSKSAPGTWREVDVLNHLCACTGFSMRGHCRHVDAVKAAEEMDRETATPAAMYPSTCPPNKEPWLLEPDACSDCSIKPAKIGGRCLLCNAKYLDRE